MKQTTKTSKFIFSRTKHLVFWLFILLVHFLPQKTQAQHYNVQQYNVNDGLVQSQVLSLCQDKYGYIWQGTGGGASRFDGKIFTNYTTKNGLTDNTVNSIKILNNGDLIFCTSNGFSLYNHLKFTTYCKGTILEGIIVFDAIQSLDGKIWLATNNGIYYILKSKIYKEILEEKYKNVFIFKLHYKKSNATLWMGSKDEGLLKYDITTKKITNYNTYQSTTLNFIYSLNAFENNKILVGTNNLGAFVINEQEQLEKLPYYKAMQYDGITGYAEDANYKWFATSGGLAYTSDNNTINYITTQNGLPTKILNCCLLDKEKNLWFGTDGFGLLKFNRFFIVQYTNNFLEPFNNINQVFEDSKGSMYTAPNQIQMVLVDDNKTIKKIENKLIIKERLFGGLSAIKKIIEGNNDEYYFIGDEILCKYKKNNIEKIPHPFKDLQKLLYTGCYNKEEDFLWIGSANGLYTYKNNVIKKDSAFTVQFGNLNLEIYDISFTNNTYYLSTSYGYITYKNGVYARINNNTAIADQSIFKVVCDHKKNEWIATPNGLFLKSNNTIENVGEKYFKEQFAIYSMIISKNNELWFGTPNGLYRFSLSNFYKGNYALKNYSKSDGIIGVECSFNGLMEDSKNNIWVCTVKGLYKINPLLETKNIQAPNLKLDMPLVFNTPINNLPKKYYSELDSFYYLPKDLILPYNLNRITFRFTAISHIKPEFIVYKVKLEGYDKDYFVGKNLKEREYVLEPGKYTFSITTQNADGVWNKKPLTYTFSISAPFWQKWWFYVLCLLSIATATFIFIKYRERKLIDEKKNLENEVADRTKDLSTANNELNSQNNIIASQKKLVEEKQKEIVDSIVYAQRIQQALLASEKMLDDFFNTEQHTDNYFVYYKPKDIVSGDFYWATKTTDAFYIIIADSTGHGVPGAFMSLLNISFLNEAITQQDITEPNEILNYVRTKLIESFVLNTQTGGGNDGMDASLLKFDYNFNTLQSANAYNNILIIRAGELIEIKADKMPVGRSPKENISFIANDFKLEKNDCIYVYTDGYADQFGGALGKKFKTTQLKELILSIHTLPMSEQYNILKNTHEHWKGQTEQLDDVLIFGVKIV